MKKQYEVPQKYNIELQLSSSPTSGIKPKEMNSYVEEKSTPMFIAALLTIDKM
jgi:hypothetical protein